MKMGLTGISITKKEALQLIYNLSSQLLLYPDCSALELVCRTKPIGVRDLFTGKKIKQPERVLYFRITVDPKLKDN